MRLFSRHVIPSRRLLAVASLALVLLPASACMHDAHAADPSTTTTTSSRPAPRVDVEVDERGGPDKSVHLAKISVLLTDGQGKVSTKDGDARIELSAHTIKEADPRVMIALNWQTERGFEAHVESSITMHDTSKVVVSQITRPDGRTTTVTAQMH